MHIRSLGLLLSALLVAAAGGQTLSGKYSSTADGVTYLLSLSQSSDGTLTGTLSNSSDLSLDLSGNAEEGEANGTGRGRKKQYYFEAGLEGGKLLFMLVETDDEGIPDFENAKELTFARQGNKPQTARPTEGGPKQAEADAEPAAKSASLAGGNDVSDPGWGFSFALPKGWKHQKTTEGAVLGHDTVAGMILLLPHSLRSLDQVRAQMEEGLQDDEGQLALASAVKSAGENLLTGEYTGVYQGAEVKATGYGTLSPYGGGAYLIAVATPDKFTTRLSSAAKTVAQSMRYKKAAAGSAPSYFFGTWVNSTKNTETRMTFHSDGTFTEYGEASYSGSSSDQYGNEGLNWGTANNNAHSGRWSARGTRERGVLTITYQSGTTRDVPYQVHVENGETYWSEYYFAGDLYGKQ
jgi:hypothetical protein